MKIIKNYSPIGIFDSGSGGLTLLEVAKKRLPEHDFLYFWDYKNCPYGQKTRAEILALTKRWVQKLQKSGAKLVILACNTATWAAIRDLQNDESLKEIKILGVTIPGAECIVERNFKKIAVFATQASIDNHLYKDRVHILDESVLVQEMALPELAIMVEKFLLGKIQKSDLSKYIREKSHDFSPKNEAIVLWCTHYSHIKEIFWEIFPRQKIICPSEESARKLEKYLQNHWEIDEKISKNATIVDISEH